MNPESLAIPDEHKLWNAEVTAGRLELEHLEDGVSFRESMVAAIQKRCPGLSSKGVENHIEAAGF